MKLRYKHAVVSFCPDLTDPNGFSVPVGVLFVGRSDGLGVAAATSVRAQALGSTRLLDPISSRIIDNLLSVLKEHVDDAIASSRGDVDLDDVLASLQRSLRNSLFVSSISAEASAVLTEPDEVQSFAVKTVLGILKGSLAACATELRERAAAIHDDQAPYLLEPAPGYLPTATWELAARRRDSHPS